MISRQFAIAVLAAASFGAAARAGDWGAPVEVRYEDVVCVSYSARMDGPYLVVRATIAPGWHTFAMDNKRRAEEKLAGKPALSIDRATEIAPVSGLTIAGPWYQSQPKDFSRPELRWFSWGFERQAMFAAKAVRAGAAPAQLAIRGQACTETICKNIDVVLTVPAGEAASGRAEFKLEDLIQVR